ncbi:unnamed protein product [Brachionus calyciflorus]|uniref:Uncharacterized protein n=1 Tax=Brachionus calyciflorus TaxID=104777 RepID=A0A814BFJ2_9BILA|nr:unnamed protein product [Brachionus calyciflorus]
MEVKLDQIDKNLEKLNSFFNDKNLKISNKILNKSEQIIKLVNNKKPIYKRKHFWDFLGVLLLLIALVLLNWEHVKFYLLYILRLLVILVSYFYDLTKFYQNNCLILNPYYRAITRFDPKTCQYSCGKTNQKNFLKQFNSEDMRSLFDKIVYDADVPVVVNNEITDWKLSSMKFQDLINDYVNNGDLIQDEHLCFFDLNIEQKSKSNVFFLKEIEKYDNFSVFWENCAKTSSKKLKKLIQRPKFLPSNLELASNSWVFVSKNINSQFVNVPVSLRINIFCQINGNSKIRISPTNECQKYCKSKSLTLRTGQLLIYTDMWNIEFKPINNETKENIAITLLAQ